jgi:hypothetical protein
VFNEFARGQKRKPKKGAIFTVTRAKVENRRDPDRTHVVYINDLEGNLIFWSGPMNIFEREEMLHLFRNYREG